MAVHSSSIFVLHAVLAVFMLVLIGQVSWSDAFCPAARSSPVSFISQYKYAAANNKNNPLFFARNNPKAINNVILRNNHRLRISALSIGAGGGGGDEGGLPIEIGTGNNNNDHVLETKSSSPSFPLVIWRFTRPHTIIGSAIAIPSIFLLAAPTYQAFFTMRSFASLIYAAVPSLFMNLYITGLNQITDVEIDKINVSCLLSLSPSLDSHRMRFYRGSNDRRYCIPFPFPIETRFAHGKGRFELLYSLHCCTGSTGNFVGNECRTSHLQLEGIAIGTLGVLPLGDLVLTTAISNEEASITCCLLHCRCTRHNYQCWILQSCSGYGLRFGCSNNPNFRRSVGLSLA
jgi:hypothetical protein